jgi:transposase-like protein
MSHKKSSVTQSKTERKKYSPQFKEQALERAKKDRVAKVAKDLGIAESIICNWRKQFEKTGIPFED